MPSGGQIVGGSGQIQQGSNTTTITQSSKVLSLNWQSFGIGADQTVQFVQPDAGSIAVNRVLGNSVSAIYGHLDANGQVWLINPNGVLFGQGAQVNAGGIVASTLDLNGTPGASSVQFAGNGRGAVINQGSIVATPGGYVALLGNTVSNQGVIRAQLGSVALAGGSAITLSFADSTLLHVQVDASTLNNLAENRQLIVADGGNVFMTAGARDALVASAVNNSGTVQARTVDDHDGSITLLGGESAGTVNVGGTLDASAPSGGSGGQIETSAAHFALASGAQVNASAAQGNAGTWLVDPVDLTIDSSAASTISSTLNGGTNVTETTTATGASGIGTQTSGNGDINVNAAISWNNAAATLELDAYRNINLNAQVSGSGGVVMNAGGGTLTVANGAGVSAGSGAIVQAGKFVNNGGASALGNAWTLYSVNPSLNTLGGLTAAYIQYNASRGSTLAASGNGLIYSVAPTLQVSGLTGSVSKVYDGTTAATLSAANLTASGLLNGDSIASVTGTYASANAASGINVTSPSSIAGYSLVNNGVPVYGYALGSAAVSAKIGQITPKQLSAEIVGDPSKVYDDTTTATLSAANYQIDGFVGSDGATVKQPSSIAYAGVDAGTQTLNATFSSTNFTANSGTNLNNYILPTTATGSGLITQAPLLISGLLANNKVYDGGTSASINTSNAQVYGVIQPDQGQVSVDYSAVAGTFAQANVGNGIAVSLSGFSLTGAKANDYQLTLPGNLSANITPKTLTIDQLTANNKTYDATTSATLNTASATLDGVVGSDNVSLNSSGASASFGQSNAGTNLAVNTSGFGLSGSAAGNYVLTQPSLLATINPALLTISMTGTPEKTYDGTSAITLGADNFNITGFIGSQHAVVSQSSASYASANAGSGINVTATLQPSDFSPDSGTAMSNYTFASTVTGAGLGKIDPLQLTGQIVGNPSKTYDGNTDASLSESNFALAGVVPGQSIAISFAGNVSGSYDDADAGARTVTAAAPAASSYSVGSGTLLSNYVLPTSFSGSGTITPAPLTGEFVLTAGIVNASKVYDGTTSITLSGSNFTLSGFVNGDSASVNDGIVANFGQKDVGTNIPLSTQLAIADLTPTGSTTQQELNNYTITNPVLGVGDITPRSLTVSIINNPTKVYNGSVVAALSSGNFSINGWVSGEGGSISPSASADYDSADAGARTVTATLTPGNYIAASGTNLNNYTLASTATGPGTITQAPLYITGLLATSRSYNATTADTLDTSRAALAGLVDSDSGNVTLDLSNLSANFSQANVGTNLAVSASGYTISGSAAANYLLQPVTGLSADITKATLTLSGISANNKTYDGTTAATLVVAGNAALNGVFGSDTVGFDSTNASGQFNSANAGSNIGVTVSGFNLTGSSAGNYQLTQPNYVSATINQKQLTASIIGSPTKVYDGSNSATLTAADYQLDGFVGSDGASVPQSATANYVTKNVGTGLGIASTLVSSDFLANPGTDLANYILPTTGAGNTGVITAKVIDLTGSRVYDGTATADSALFGTIQGVNGETLGVSGSGTLVTKNVGSELAFSDLGTLALTNGGNGGLASNYTLVGGTDWVTITPRALTATFDASNKIYDGSTADTLSNAAFAAVSGNANSGLINGDDVSLTNPTAGNFDNKNVGTGKTVTGAMGISGADAGNYVFTNGTAQADITAKHITISATGKNKQYDATTNDPGVTIQTTGLVSGDKVSFNVGSATFADPNVNNNIAVTVNGVTAGGTDGGNYIIDDPNNLMTSANITPRILNLNATRIYDGSTTADASLFVSNGVLNTGIAGQTLTLSGSGSTSNKNVGSNKTVSLGSLSLGNGSGAASNYTLVGGTDRLTITQRPLTATFDATNKVYDGTTADVLTDAALVLANGSTTSGLIAGDNVSLTNPTAGTFDTKNVGTGKTVTGAMGITGSDAANYVFTNGTAVADITKADLLVTALGSNKTYDGTTTASVTLSGGVAGDNLQFSDTSANYDSKNAGTQGINVLGISVSGADAGNYNLLNTTAQTSGTINPVVLNLDGTRVYDGSADADASLFGNAGSLAGINGETVTLSGSGAVADKNVGTDKAFASLGTLSLANGSNGGLAQNYTLVGGTDTLTITPKPISLSAVAGNKVYDTTTTATAMVTGNGVIPGDDVQFSNGDANFVTANAGNNLQVDITGISGSGVDIGNYSFSNSTTTTANITPAVLNLSGSRVYDGSTSADAGLFGDNGVLTGLNGQTLNLSGSGVLGDKNVGTDKALNNLGTLSLGNGDNGGLASNYTLVGGVDTLTVTPRPIVVSANGHDKTYDGGDSATVDLSSSGVLPGDQIQFGDGSAVFASPDVGNGIAIAVTGIHANGDDAGNYSYNTSTDTQANITAYVLNLSTTRVFDDGDTVSARLFGDNGVVPGVDGQTLTVSGNVTLDTSNVGTQTLSSAQTSGLSLSGNDGALASNYALDGSDITVTTLPANAATFGNEQGTLAQLQGQVGSTPLQTPYGVADQDSVGVFTGNQKKQHRPIERNRQRVDFISGLGLRVINGGVQMPSQAMP